MGSSANKTPPNSNPATRSTTPHPNAPQPPQGPTNDHVVSDFRHRLSQREYPPDCPPLNVRWYYAVDVPKRKPFSTDNSDAGKSAKKPSKFLPFTAHDSRTIEVTYQKLSSEEDAVESTAYSRHSAIDAASGDIADLGPVHSIKEPEDERNWKVPVNEDYLFDVDIRRRELAPVFWLGPTYDVQRGTWFFQEGSTLRPCGENLATQIEEGYLKIKPWRTASTEKKPKTPALDSTPKTISDSATPPVEERPSSAIPFLYKASTGTSKDAPTASQPLQTWRLFGAHLNSFVVFADANTAWLLTDDFYGKLSATVWQRITAGTHMGGAKIVRGFTETAKVPEKKNDKDALRASTPPPSDKDRSTAIDEDKKNRRKSMPPPATSKPAAEEELNTGHAALHRKMSSYVEESQEEMLEAEMKEDYQADQDGDEQGREIEHLLLVTHGIGQKLGLRMDSVNFVHDVNVFRKSLKSVYSISPDLQVLNNETGSEVKNCRIQCLPVCWRHMLEFPKQSLRQNRGEHDLSSGSAGSTYEDEYPSLEDITVEGVPSIRNLMTDLALDVLLYQSSTYREHIIQTVRNECNRIYALFKQRNPEFKGKVSLVGHSLGSAILFDILCRQPNEDGREGSRSKRAKHGGAEVSLDFPVENFFCLGSPVGLFQMLKGRTIASRKHANLFIPARSTGHLDFNTDSFLSPQPSFGPAFPISSPKCQQLFNIFHPSDPIAYRIEPLVSKAMTELKVQPLPYTKRSLFSSNGQIVGGISGIGQSVTRSVSNMWSSLSSGIASSILNRSLGIDGSTATATSTNHAAITEEKKDALMSGEGQHPPTMIDAEIETLYAGFQKRRKSATENEGGLAEQDAEEEARRLRKEEDKVRALNDTGRIDFAIQEGVFDISLIASIASHLSYWSDQDVNHFVISQLLSRQRVIKRKKGEAGVLGAGASLDDGAWDIGAIDSK